MASEGGTPTGKCPSRRAALGNHLPGERAAPRTGRSVGAAVWLSWGRPQGLGEEGVVQTARGWEHWREHARKTALPGPGGVPSCEGRSPRVPSPSAGAGAAAAGRALCTRVTTRWEVAVCRGPSRPAVARKGPWRGPRGCPQAASREENGPQSCSVPGVSAGEGAEGPEATHRGVRAM